MSSLVRLTRPQKRRLQRVVQRGREARPVRRAQVVLQLASGVGVTEPSEGLSVARSTVYRWVMQFRALGEAWLTACDSGGPAYTVDETLRETLLELVNQPPGDDDYLRSTWTSEMLAQTLAALLERPVHASTVRRELSKLGLRWRRARPTLCIRHPCSAERKRAINRQLAQIQTGTEVFYVDEADIDLNPKIGFLWSPLVQQQTIPTPGKNQKRYLAGALHARTGRVDYVEGLRKKTDLFLCLLEHLKRTYRSARKIVLIADNTIIHKSNLAHAWMNHNPNFEILFQPAYQPWVNDIEKLWKQLHDNITRNHHYPTIEKLMVAVRTFLREASPLPGNQPSVAKYGSAI